VVTVPAAPAVGALFNRFDITERVHLIKFGVNYRFGYY
jgi:hypothetical protein